MTTIVTRAGKGAPLSWSEADANFTNLNSAVIAAQATADAALAGASTDLGYVTATRTLTSSTGADVVLPEVSSGAAGLAPASGGGTTNYLRADGTWAAPPGGGSGTVTSVGITTAGATDAVTISGSPVTTSGNITVTVNTFSSTTAGVVPSSGGGTSNFLRADGTWAAPGGSGSPGGSTTQVQFNDGGSFAGSSVFTWDKTNNTLSIGDRTNASYPLNIPCSQNDTNFRVFIQNGDGSGSADTLLARIGTRYAGVGNVVSLNFNRASGTTGGSFYITQGSNTAFYIFSDGNVRIGNSTTNPSVKLHVDGATKVYTGDFTVEQTSGADPTMYFYRATSGAGSGIGRFLAEGLNSSSARVEYSRIQTEIVANTAGSHTGRILFSTARAGARTQAAEMASNGDFTASGNVTAYSDIRYKINIKTVENALGLVAKMRGVTFDRTDTGESGVGVIAQEMEEVLPQVVITNLEGIKSVAYGNIVGVLIEAIKELKAEVEELKRDLGR